MSGTYMQWFSLALSPCPTVSLRWRLDMSFRATPLDAQHHEDLQPELPCRADEIEASGMPPFSKASKPWHKWISWRMWKQTPPGRPVLELEHGADFFFVGFSGCIHSWANVSNCDVRNRRYVTWYIAEHRITERTNTKYGRNRYDDLKIRQ